MQADRIAAALAAATDTEQVVMGSGVLAETEDVFRRSFGDQPAQVIADGNTFAVAGQMVDRLLRSHGRQVHDPFIFPGEPMLYADYRNVERLANVLHQHDAVPVVVGAGTLNDITKGASHLAQRPYMVVATAASMDGYTSFGAAITQDGFKRTMACPAPRAVVADLDVLATAPLWMTASGYADLLGKITAGADWLIADALEVEPIEPHAWSLVQDSLRAWTANPALLRQGDPQAVAFLSEGLILVGLAMQAHRTSRPASGSEHQFSHLWEMEGHLDSGEHISHGFKVGIGTIASAALYEQMLARDLHQIDIEAICRAWPTRNEFEARVRHTFPQPEMTEKAVEESLLKYTPGAELATRLRLLVERWPDLQARLQTQMMAAAQIRTQLEQMGCPVDPAEIGVDRPRLRASYTRAWQIRRRYTIFDLAAESGAFAACVDELFAPGGFWAA